MPNFELYNSQSSQSSQPFAANSQENNEDNDNGRFRGAPGFVYNQSTSEAMNSPSGPVNIGASFPTDNTHDQQQPNQQTFLAQPHVE